MLDGNLDPVVRERAGIVLEGSQAAALRSGR
jgi:hypothetical protein